MHLHLLPLLPLLATVSAGPDEIRFQAETELADQVDTAIANDPHPPAVDTNATQLLFGGGDEYAPVEVDCPAGVGVRGAGVINPNEQAYLTARAPIIHKAVGDMTTAAGIPAPTRDPVIGLALSGGGYRAMLSGLGMTMALMKSHPEADAAGTGGWLDAVSYMAGLSGGAWGVGTFAANNGTLPTSLVDVWHLDDNLIWPEDGKIKFFRDLISNVRAKTGEDFPTQITDYWGLALGEHLLPEEYRMENNPNFTMGALLELGVFQNAQMPVPIILAAEREPGEIIVPANATLWEFTPWEFGAWAVGYDNVTDGYFTDINTLGSTFSDGEPTKCFVGFDQLSFIMGTSSTLFNYALVALKNKGGILADAIEEVLEKIGEQKNDIAQIPNFARDYNKDTNPLAGNDYLALVDAGETEQNIPLDPLLVPARKVDAIIAFDSSSDTDYTWPDGSSMYSTYKRAVEFARHQRPLRMPEVPLPSVFVGGGLNTRPVFFGCNSTTEPIVVYVPQYPWSEYSNSSTYELEYTNGEAEAHMLSAMRSLTLNGTVDEWPKCLTCALTDRANAYTAQNRSAECAQCFKTWCWNGDNVAALEEYIPEKYQTPPFLVENKLSDSVQG